MILTNRQTAALVQECGMIVNYEPEKVSEVNGNRIMSYGQAGAAYDYRLGNDVRVMTYDQVKGLDALDLSTVAAYEPPSFDYDRRAFVRLPPFSLALATTLEAWKLPLNIVVINHGKSSYARLGLLYSIPPFDPGWEGVPTITLHNPTAAAIRLYVGEGIATAVHHQLSERVAPYSGKYQGQMASVTHSR